MLSSVRFYRGVTAGSSEEAIKSGLALKNASSATRSSFCEGGKPPGGFFTYGSLNEFPKNAEMWAIMVSQRENKTPVVIDMTVNPNNFQILQGRVHAVKKSERRGGDGYQYIPIINFEDFEYNQVEAVINLAELSHEDLMALGVKVGFLGQEGGFEYRPYEEWTHILGVHAPTREDRINQEGKPFQLRNDI